MRNWIKLISLFNLLILLSGCIRLWGGAGYMKQTPREQTERVVGFDTAK